MKYEDFNSVNDVSGFANGVEFTSETQVCDYFTVENFQAMFSGDEDPYSSEELREMADKVIANKWHCNF